VDVLVLDRLGPSLEDLMQKKNTFDLALTLNIGDQALRILEGIHSRSYIHRDVKPDNFLFGATVSDMSKIFMVDFGLAVRFVTRGGQHVPFRSDRRLTGTA